MVDENNTTEARQLVFWRPEQILAFNQNPLLSKLALLDWFRAYDLIPSMWFRYASGQVNPKPYPPERTTDWAPTSPWPAIPATWGKCAPHCRQSNLSFQNSPTWIPCRYAKADKQALKYGSAVCQRLAYLVTELTQQQENTNATRREGVCS